MIDLIDPVQEKARLEVLKFLRSNKAQIRDNDFYAVIKSIEFLGFPVYTKKEYMYSVVHYLFNIIKIREEKLFN